MLAVEPHAGLEGAEIGIVAGVQRIAPGTERRVGQLARNVRGLDALAGGVRHRIEEIDVGRRGIDGQRVVGRVGVAAVLRFQVVMGEEVGIGLVVHREVAEGLLQVGIIEVRHIQRRLVAEIGLGGRVVVQHEVAAVRQQVGQGHARGGVLHLAVIGAQQRQAGGVVDVEHPLAHVVLAMFAGIGQVAFGAFALVVEETAAVAGFAAVQLQAAGGGVEAAIGAIGVEGEVLVHVLGAKAHGAAEGRLADGAGAARAAVHFGLAQVMGDEQGGGGVVQVGGVAERNAVEGDVVLAVLEAADRQGFGLADARAVGALVEHAGFELDDVVEAGLRNDVVLDEALLHHRGRLDGVGGHFRRGDIDRLAQHGDGFNVTGRFLGTGGAGRQDQCANGNRRTQRGTRDGITEH